MLEKLKTFVFQDSKRVWSGALMVAVLAIVFWINNFTLVWGLMGVLYILAYYESIKLYQVELDIFSFLLAIALWCLLYFSSNSFAVALLILCLSVLPVFFDTNNKFAFRHILPFIYPTLPFIAIYVLYVEYGVSYLIWLICIVALADICAYYGGKQFGRTPLCSVSPKKTIEGALCGVACSTIVGAITGIGMFGNFYMAIFISIIVALCSIVGDLFESALKRQAGIKDSGNILPGHGGILDRTDAVMFGAIAMLFCLSMLSMYQL